jgi:hypothetical protein
MMMIIVFAGVPLSKDETLDLIAAAVSIYLKNTLKGMLLRIGLDWIVLHCIGLDCIGLIYPTK